jgi:hypothetical protein
MARKLSLSGNKGERSVREERACNRVVRPGVETRRAVPLSRVTANTVKFNLTSTAHL